MKMFKQLFEHNITNCNGQFFCHLCTSAQSTITNVLNHMHEEKHQKLKCDETITILEDNVQKEYSELTKDQVAVVMLDTLICIPCREVCQNLHSMLQHVQSEMHIKKLKAEQVSFDCDKNSNEIQIAVFKSKISQKVKKINLQEVTCTVKKHAKCIPFKIIRISHNYLKNDYEILVKNGIVFVDYYRYMCLICYHCYATLYEIQQHINTAKHEYPIKEIDKELHNGGNIEIKDTYASSEAKAKPIEFNFPESKHNGQDKSSKLLVSIDTKTEKKQNTNCSENQKTDKSLPLTKELYDFQEREYQLFKSNKIILSLDGLKCNVCMCSLPSLDHVLPHIEGKQHTVAIKERIKEKEKNDKNVNSKITNDDKKIHAIETQCANKKTAVIVSKETTVKIREPNLYANDKHEAILTEIQQELVRNGITFESNTFFCTVCKRNLSSVNDTLPHINGKSHRKVMKRMKPKAPVDTVTCNISIENNEIECKAKNDSISQEYSYHCELCNARIHIDDLFDHINSVTHKCNTFSMNMGDDVILYDCFCCKSIIQGNSLLINHLSSKTHLNNLASTLKNIRTRNIKVFVCIAGDTKNTLKNGNFPLCNVLVPQVEATSMPIIGNRLIFFNIAQVKLCDDVKNNIPYRCSLCDVKLLTDHNLIEHCKSKMHLWKIKQWFFGKKQPVIDNDIMLISEKLNDTSVADKELSEVKTLVSDLVVSEDVYVDVTKHLSASPFSKKPPADTNRKEKSLIERLNKVCYKKHLKIEEEMYTLSKQKLDDIKSNFKLFISHNNTNLYCLACDAIVSKELYLLYEHVRLKSHVENFGEIKKNRDKKKLLNQYMKQTPIGLIKCYPCRSSVFNNTESIIMHIAAPMHEKNCKKLSTFIDNTLDCLLQDLSSLWYNIQRFSCISCNAGFKYKLEFIEHIIAKHQNLKQNVFDFCIPCATLWLGQTNSYTEHCKDIVHKYLVKSKDFLIEDLPTCIKELLTQVDETVDILIKQTQVLMSDNVQQEVVQSLEKSIKVYFPSVKAYLFGSRVTGLGSANSDIDVYLDCGGTYYDNRSQYTKNYLLYVEQALRKQKDEWEVKQTLEGTRTPIIKLIYKRTGVHCDISFTNGLSVENSKLIRSFIDAYSPSKQLVLFIKKWLSLFDLPGRHGFTSYALVWLVIFYLQLESHLPSVAILIKERNNSRRICDWETGVAQPKSNNESVQPVSTLLLEFFKFYANFDYQHYIICPLMGYPLPKDVFTELYTLPKQMKPYIEQLKNSEKPEYFRIDSPLCVQDPFDLSHNLTKAVNSITLKYFKQYCKQSASVLLSTTQ